MRNRTALLYIFVFVALIPLHELGHLLVAQVQGLSIVSVDLFSLTPSVVVEGRGHVLFNLAGMLLTVPVPLSLAILTKTGEGKAEFFILAIATASMGFFDVLNFFF